MHTGFGGQPMQYPPQQQYPNTFGGGGGGGMDTSNQHGYNSGNTSYNTNNFNNANNNSNNNANNGGGGGGAFGGGGSAFGGGFGGHAQNMILDIGKQNLEQYMKVGEQSFLTNYIPFVKDLRQYFRVDHRYVGRKAALLFAPFLQKKIASGSGLAEATFGGGGNPSFASNSNNGPSLIRSASSTVGGGGVGAQFNFGDDAGFGFGNTSRAVTNGSSSPTPMVATGGLHSPTSPLGGTNNSNKGGAADAGFHMPSPVDDVLAPDLYIPSMALLTYVALCGFIRGLTHDSLSPEFLAAMLWSLVLWEAFEVGVVMVASYALMTPMTTLDALALAGYKHVGVCFLLLVRELLGLSDSYLYLVPVVYVAACSVLFAYNTIKMFISRRGDGTVHARSLPLLYGWAGVQALFVFWFAMKPF